MCGKQRNDGLKGGAIVGWVALVSVMLFAGSDRGRLLDVLLACDEGVYICVGRLMLEDVTSNERMTMKRMIA